MSRVMSARPSPAMVVALVALFVALSGSAFAVKKLDQVGKNDIKSGHVKNGTLTSKDLKNGNGVKGVDVKNDSLSRRDLAADSVSSSEVADGSLTGSDVANNALGGQQIDESGLGQVPAAATALNADQLGGVPPGGFAPVAAGLKAAFVYNDGNIENDVGGPFTVDDDGNGVETITFPFDVNNGDFHVVAGSGGASALGGVNPCIVTVEAQTTDQDTIAFELVNPAGDPCNEEFTVLVF